MLKLLRRLAPCLALLAFLAPSWAQTLPQGVASSQSPPLPRRPKAYHVPDCAS